MKIAWSVKRGATEYATRNTRNQRPPDQSYFQSK